VDRELVEHAARVLRTEPGRTMEARALYDRVSRETGIRCGASLLLQKLRNCPDRFSLLPGPGGGLDACSWSDAERRSYAGLLPLLEQAAPSLVALCETEPAADEGGDHASDPDGLAAVQRSIVELLRCAGGDEQLRAAVGSAVAALTAATAAIADPGVSPPARAAARSTTAPRSPRLQR
jgi:hypothetical protein